MTNPDWVGSEPFRPEHPRPDRRRVRWRSLEGQWEFAFDDANRGRELGWSSGTALADAITVPYTFETSLSGIGRPDEVHEWVWYRRHFVVDPAWTAGRVLLHFAAVDWAAEVWVNGVPATTHSGGYTGFSCDVTSLLRAAGEQELVVRVHDPASPHNGGHQPRGKQRGSWRIWYARTTGIWGPVWLEHVGQAYLDRPRLEPDAQTGDVQVTPDLVPAGAGHRVRAEVCHEGVVVAAAEGDGRGFVVSVPDRRLWSPEDPVLYEVRLQVLHGTHVEDEVTSWCAFRQVSVRAGRIELNGRPVSLRGVLDQGYWPDGGYTAPSQHALRRDVEVVKELGFNAVRKHVKVEDPHWYHWCDRVGLLVLQDMPSSQDLSTEAAREDFRQEWAQVVDDLRGHPSVVVWVLFNEDWGSPGRGFQSELVAWTRQADPTRLLIEASGWISYGQGDLEDLHDYTAHPGELVSEPHHGRARVMGEFGGVSHRSAAVDGWGYSSVDTPSALLASMARLVRQLDDPERLTGWVYTQLTDVERETNGLLTAARVAKAAPEEVAAVVVGRPVEGQG